MKKLLRDALRWVYWQPLRRCLALLPLSWSFWLAQGLGALMALARPRRVQALAEEYRRLPALALTTAESEALARLGLAQGFVTSIEGLSFPRFTKAWASRHTRIHGQEHLDVALKAGRGALLLVAHLGPNQLLMPILGHRGYHLNQLGAKPDTWHRLVGQEPNLFERAIFETRHTLEQSLPATFLYLERSMRPAFRCLQQGQMLIMALEGRAGAHWVQAPILGRRANLAAGPFFIARRVGSPVLPCAVLREADGSYSLHIMPPVPECAAATREEAWQAEATLAAEAFAPLMRFAPEQYGQLLFEARVRAPFDAVPLFADAREVR